MPDDVDFAVSNHGSLFMVAPLSEAACEFSEVMFADAMSLGGSYAVEHRYIEDIVADLVNEQGFAVTLDGNLVVEMRPI